MAQVRFLDQVPVGVYNVDPIGGGGTIDIYQNGILVSSSVPYVNISGSATVQGFAPFGTNDGVTIIVQGVGFPFSGSAVITGSLVISGSSQPIILQTLPVQDINYIVTYNPTTGVVGYVNSTSGTSGFSGSSGTAGQSGTSGTAGSSGSSGSSGVAGNSGQSAASVVYHSRYCAWCPVGIVRNA